MSILLGNPIVRCYVSFREGRSTSLPTKYRFFRDLRPIETESFRIGRLPNFGVNLASQPTPPNVPASERRVENVEKPALLRETNG